jgi:hypothetical protein
MTRLQELEYVLVHRGGRGQSFVYELLYDGELDDNKHLMGLIDVEKLQYDEKKEPPAANKEPSSSPQVVAKEPPGSPAENSDKLNSDNDLGEDEPETDKKGFIRPKNTGESYRNATPSLVAKGR